MLFLVEYKVRLTGIKLKKYRGCSFRGTLWKRQSFLYESNWKVLQTWLMTEFSFDAPFIAPIKTRHHLHQTNLAFLQTSHYKLDCTGYNHSLYEGEQILCIAICVALGNKFLCLLILHFWDYRQMLVSILMQFDFQKRLRDVAVENQRWMCWYLWFTDENNFLSFST